MGLFFLKEDTAVDTKLGPFVDKGDGVTYEVGMSAAMDNAATGVRLSKNGGAFADRNEGTAPAYDAFGYYLVKLDATDTNTPGRLKVIFGDAAVCLPCEANFQVLHANVFDSLFGAAAADLLDVNVAQWLGTACHATSEAGVPKVDLDQIGGVVQSATDLKDFADEGYNPATNKVQGVVLVDTTTTNTDMAQAPASIDAILTDTGEIGAAGAGLTNINLPNQTMDITGDITGSLSGSVGSLTGHTNQTADYKASVEAILVDTGELQTDWTNGGRLDLIIDELTTQGDTNEGKIDTIDGIVDNILEDTDGTHGVAIAAASMDAIWDRTEGITGDSHSFETMFARVYRYWMNKLNITDATGAAALRNEADGADIATQTITDAAGTTTRTKVTWS